MKRPVQIGLGFSAGVVGLLVVVGIVLVARLDGIVRQTVERESTAQLGLQTSLQNAGVSLLGGQLTLDKMAVANPPGFESPSLFELGQVRVGVGIRGLRSDPVRVDVIDIHSPHLTIERAAGEGLSDQFAVNLRQLVENLAALETADDPTLLLINRLTVHNARVTVRPNIAGLRESYALTLPDITLNDVGTAGEARNGAEIGRVVGEVAVALARQAADSEELPAELRALLRGDLASVVDAYADEVRTRLRDEAGRAVDRVRDAASDDAVQRAEEEARRRVGNLLGGNRRERDNDQDGQ